VHFSAINAASYTVEITDNRGNYPPGSAFEGMVIMRFDTLLPQDAQLVATVDGSNPSYLDVQPYVNGTSYQFRSYQFSYNLVANGKNQWYEYPNKQFWYRIKVEGTCGDDYCTSSGTCDCPCTPPYCYWNIVYVDTQDSVRADDGLKFIVDMGTVIAPPTSANPADTKWSELLNNPTSQYGVQTTMRMACGNMYYAGQLTDQNGWVKMTLQNFQTIPGTYWQKATVGPFDQNSLTTDRQKFISASCSQPYVCGGIYKGTTLLTSGTDYTANGTSGEVIIKTYSPSAVYTMVYLPPNGPVLCAYTTSKVSNSTTWTRTIQQSGSVSYSQPFSKTYTQTQLPSVFNDTNKGFINPPACPYYAMECNQTATSYSVVIANDPTGGYISLSPFNSQTRTVTATLTSPEIANRMLMIDLSDFMGLKAPSSEGQHALAISLESAGSELARSEVIFSVCEDNDHDGYCSDSDCNNTNPNIHPGAPELCNGIDDNCDGQIDETFHAAGSKLGTACGIGACSGTWVCAPNQTAVICNITHKPGIEICDNLIDDDCDGEIDEHYENSAQGNPVRACYCQNEQYTEYCICQDGQRKPCGSNVGACKQGYQVCAKGQWSKCLNAVGPSQELCNSLDDDCNGIIDDVNGGNSIATAACGCYGGAFPSAEICDEIDNDCNELIDDGIQCCKPSQTRKCGSDIGFCKSGIQVCDKNGEWGFECKGEVKPADGNCNTPVSTCQNGKKDTGEEGVDCGGACTEPCGMPFNWLLVAGGVILIIVTLMFLELRGKL
jgi:hypothetical protein